MRVDSSTIEMSETVTDIVESAATILISLKHLKRSTESEYQVPVHSHSSSSSKSLYPFDPFHPSSIRV
ncbi:hypothetical protein Dimus_001918 [Dionaea muscipula]